MKKVLVTLIFMLATGISLYAQSPEGFKYQAVMRDATNTILTNQPVGIELTILQGGASGTPVYTETFSVTTNAYGLINVEIGSGVTLDDFALIDWANGPYFIETGLDATGGTNYQLMGTSQFLSVPYALHAKTVEIESQDITLTGTNLSITGGSTVDLSVLQDGVNDADADPNNEIQSLSLSGTDLTISGGNTVTLPSGGAADNWGSDVVNSDASLVGDGTVGNPLSVSGDLTDDQNLSLAGTNLSIDNGNSVDLAPLQDGTGTDDQTISLTGTNLSIESGNTVDLSTIDTDTQLNEAQVDAYVSNNGYITNPDDADADPNNEIQSLNLVGNDLTISGGNTVTLPSGGGADNWGTDVVNSDATLFGDGTVGNPLSVSGDLTDDQNLTLVGTDLTIDNGNAVDLSSIDTDTQLDETQVDAYVSNNGYITNPDDADADPNNEIQSLNLVGNDLTISGGNTVTLPSGGGADNWGTDVVNSDGTLVGDGTSGNPLSVSGDLTDDQNLSLVGTTLIIDNGNTVDLSSVQDGVNDSDSDPTNEYNTGVALSGTTLSVTDAGGSQSVDLSSLQDGVTDADADPGNEIQSLSLSGNDLTISGGNTVILPTGGSSIWSEAGNNVFVTSDSVGIGTNTPNHKFQVASLMDFGNYNIFVGDSSGDNNGTGIFNTGIGHYSIENYTTGSANTALGLSALRMDTSGNNNTALGAVALGYNLSGDNNIAVGAAALRHNKTGDRNIAIGVNAIDSCVSSSDNIAIGYKSIERLLYGHDNVGIGTETLSKLSNGFSNTAIGHKTLMNCLADGNTAVGSEAMTTNRTGINNVAVGVAALLWSQTTKNNVAIGAYSMSYDTLGSNCVAIGANTLVANVQDGQVAIGYQAMRKSETGSENVAIGARAMTSSRFGGDNVAIGYEAMMDAKSSGNVAIGNHSLQRDSTGFGNVSVGSQNLVNNNGNFNVAVGRETAYGLTTGDGNTLLGARINGPLTMDSSIVVGVGAAATGNHQIVLKDTATFFMNSSGNFGLGTGSPLSKFTLKTSNGYGLLHTNGTQEVGSYVNASGGWYGTKSNHDLHFFTNDGSALMTVDVNESVGINTTSPSASYKLDVNGDIRCVSLTQTSDAKFKTNVKPLKNSLSGIKQLQGVYFDWKTTEYPEKEFSTKKQIGFIAQEVEEIYPELVETDENGNKSVAYAKLVPVLVEAIKDQQRTIGAQQQALEEQREQIEEMETKASKGIELYEVLLKRIELLETSNSIASE